MVVYHNVDSESVREQFADLIGEIERKALLYPVTVVDGAPVYDGAVSYPAIMRAVQERLAVKEQRSEA
jgi:disulfide oxidoreductase YuzD